MISFVYELANLLDWVIISLSFTLVEWLDFSNLFIGKQHTVHVFIFHELSLVLLVECQVFLYLQNLVPFPATVWLPKHICRHFYFFFVHYKMKKWLIHVHLHHTNLAVNIFGSLMKMEQSPLPKLSTLRFSYLCFTGPGYVWRCSVSPTRFFNGISIVFFSDNNLLNHPTQLIPRACIQWWLHHLQVKTWICHFALYSNMLCLIDKA